MSLKTPKEYQNKAVDKLLSRSKEILDECKSKTIVFQSPTGSGKTFMMSQYIYELIEENEDKDICFLWFSIGKGELHKQSFESLDESFQGYPECYLLEDEFFGSRESIAKNEVVVVNWEKLRSQDKKTGEWKNLLMKDKETVNFRELVKNTQEEEKVVVLIIDESHSNATSDRAMFLRDEIVKPDLTIEMSATPPVLDGDEKVVVDPKDVIDAGMIKKEIVINEGLDKIEDDEITSQELILESAFLKRKELKKLFEEKGLNINPLVLIQIPTGESGKDKKEFIEKFLESKKVTVKNKKLAIWLNEEKVNQDKNFIKQSDDKVEFLIFKQAIDTGWDCPRAQILVKFREMKSMTFEIQTVGRILRMPEAQHYAEDKLNIGYVYSNLQSIKIKKEIYNPNILKSLISKRRSLYKNISLTSYYRNRVDFGDVTSSFYEVLESEFCKEFVLKKDSKDFEKNKELVSKKINLDITGSSAEIIFDEIIDSAEFEKLVDKTIQSDKNLSVKLSSNDLLSEFENLIKENLHGYAPKRSMPTVKESFYLWVEKYLGIKKVGVGAIYTQGLVVSNRDVFSSILDSTILKYKDVKEKEVITRIKDIEEVKEDWEILSIRNYSPNSYKKEKYNKNIYEPIYIKFDSEIEKNFINDVLEKENKIEWWWQNGGEHMQANFGIKYYKKENKISHTFQPDFIIKLKDGRVGIFDTKAKDDRLEDQKVKSEALQKYINKQNKKGNKLFGGLVIKDGVHYKINQKSKYKSFLEKNRDWEVLKF
jgi:type III restriction enzyme